MYLTIADRWTLRVHLYLDRARRRKKSKSWESQAWGSIIWSYTPEFSPKLDFCQIFCSWIRTTKTNIPSNVKNRKLSINDLQYQFPLLSWPSWYISVHLFKKKRGFGLCSLSRACYGNKNQTILNEWRIAKVKSANLRLLIRYSSFVRHMPNLIDSLLLTWSP